MPARCTRRTLDILHPGESNEVETRGNGGMTRYFLAAIGGLFEIFPSIAFLMTLTTGLADCFLSFPQSVVRLSGMDGLAP